ncbi:hypothetical protein JCM3770_000262 [Rhodotorula araucariae]
MLARKRVKAFFRKHFSPEAASSTPSSPGGSAGPSPPLTRASSRPATPRSHHPPSGVTVADRPITQPRPHRRRRRRRTTSPVGLPLYSAEPGEEEMSIFKSQDMDSSRLDLSLSRATTGEGSFVDGSEAEAEGDEAEEGGALEDEEDEHSFFARPSVDVSTDSHRRSPALLTPPLVIGRPRSASEPLGARRGRSASGAPIRPGLSPYLSHSPGGSSPFASRSGLIDVPVRPASPLTSPTPIPQRPTHLSHRSSRSSPVNTPTSPSLPMGRPRASTLQRLLGSSANSSATSLVHAGGGVAQATSPYGSLGSRASSSTMSIREQGISMPLPNSFVHSSFVFPKSGPTPQQVAFLSSRESLGAYGYGPGVAAPREPAPEPPAFAFEPGPPAAAGALAPVRPATGRGRSASAASAVSGSSPLAREVTHTPPPGEPAPASAAVDAVLLPRLPALRLDTTPLALALALSPPSPSTAPSPLPSPSPSPLSLPFSDAPATMPPHRPPEIVTFAPTPTASAAPSPRLGPAAGPDAGPAAFPASAPDDDAGGLEDDDDDEEEEEGLHERARAREVAISMRGDATVTDAREARAAGPPREEEEEEAKR